MFDGDARPVARLRASSAVASTPTWWWYCSPIELGVLKHAEQEGLKAPVLGAHVLFDELHVGPRRTKGRKTTRCRFLSHGGRRSCLWQLSSRPAPHFMVSEHIPCLSDSDHSVVAIPPPARWDDGPPPLPSVPPSRSEINASKRRVVEERWLSTASPPQTLPWPPRR